MSAHLSDLDRDLRLRLLRRQLESRAEHRRQRQRALRRLEIAVLWFVCGAVLLWVVVAGV